MRVIEQYRSEKEISLRGKNIPNPVFLFDEAGFPDYVMKEIKCVNCQLLYKYYEYFCWIFCFNY